MTRKDYEKIAAVLFVNRPGGEDWMTAHKYWKELCCNFSNSLASENPRFDRERFLKACGVAG